MMTMKTAIEGVVNWLRYERPCVKAQVAVENNRQVTQGLAQSIEELDRTLRGVVPNRNNTEQTHG